MGLRQDAGTAVTRPDAISARSGNNVFLSSGNSLYHYGSDGTLHNSFTFTPDPALVYSDVSAKGGTVYASFNSNGFAGNGVSANRKYSR